MKPAKFDRIAITGPELRAARKAAGFSQCFVARMVGCTRHAVRYWEGRGAVRIDREPARSLCGLLNWQLQLGTATRDAGEQPEPLGDVFGAQYTRARGWGLTIDAQFPAGLRDRSPLCPKPPILCGAKTRKGAACRRKPEADKTRCKFHGGKSTGPKTSEGKARIQRSAAAALGHLAGGLARYADCLRGENGALRADSFQRHPARDGGIFGGSKTNKRHICQLNQRLAGG